MAGLALPCALHGLSHSLSGRGQPVAGQQQCSAHSAAEVPVAVTGPISAVKYAITAAQEATGVPWWATLVACGVFFRVATWPLTIQQLKASKGLAQGYARATAAQDALKGDLPAALSHKAAAAARSARRRELFALVRAHRATSGDTHAIWLAGPVTQARAPCCLRARLLLPHSYLSARGSAPSALCVS